MMGEKTDIHRRICDVTTVDKLRYHFATINEIVPEEERKRITEMVIADSEHDYFITGVGGCSRIGGSGTLYRTRKKS